MDFKNDTGLLLVINGSEGLSGKQKQDYFINLLRQFADAVIITAVQKEELPEVLQACRQVSFGKEKTKVQALNEAARSLPTSMILLLEGDEHLSIAGLPPRILPENCYQALIDVTGSADPQQNYQLRIFPNIDGEQLFEGEAIPCLNKSFTGQGWMLSSEIIAIHKEGALFKLGDVRTEAKSGTPKGIFWQAVLHSQNQNYVAAENCFKQILSADWFLFDYLAVLNGLANALAEQHKLEEARTVAMRSLTVDKHQRAPYLTLFKSWQLAGEPKKAYQQLQRYLEVLKHASRANLDVYLSPSECHFLMAEITFKEGDFEKAFFHYDYFYECNNGKVSQVVLEKLFIYAIELKNYKKSVQYFNDIFGAYLPDKLDEAMSARLLEALSLFMDNEWYDFVSDCYEQLFSHNPDNNRLLHGWITTLIKNEEVARAQALLRNRKTA